MKPKDRFPPSERTGTIWDEYMEVIPLLAIYAQKIKQFDKEGQEFKKAVSDFEKQFRPGDKDGIMDSIFMSWMYFDFRFGTSLETVAERLLADPIVVKLHEPGPTYIKQLNDSYLTFYEIIKKLPDQDAIIVEELGTGEHFTVFHIRELLEIEPVVGEIWYAQRVGRPERSIFFTTPYIFAPEAKPGLRRACKMQEKDFIQGPEGALFPADRHFAESQKKATPFWVWFVLRKEEELPQIEDKDSALDEDIDKGQLPILLTTDGEEFILAEIYFSIRDKEALCQRLATLKSFQYDKLDGSWTWFKAKSRKYPEKPRTVLGYFCIDGNFLIAETNSRERATRLRFKLKRHLGSLIAYEKTLYREPYDFPELSPEESEARRKESEELQEAPEVQEAMKKYLEFHYYTEWPETKIPALGGLTPVQAVKQDEARAKVIALIDEFERRQELSESKMPKIDFNRLRRQLGLPPKAS